MVVAVEAAMLQYSTLVFPQALAKDPYFSNVVEPPRKRLAVFCKSLQNSLGSKTPNSQTYTCRSYRWNRWPLPRIGQAPVSYDVHETGYRAGEPSTTPSCHKAKALTGEGPGMTIENLQLFLSQTNGHSLLQRSTAGQIYLERSSQ